ncbi:MAG TPA: DNA repair protein RecO [Acidiferrobacter sp.]|nr:DNA repair protein RecO [Acidiferrobacter sp.]
MRIQDERAFVLHHYPYGETSVLLEVFTLAFGRVGIIARGARRAGRAFAGAHLRPFQPLLISWSGRGELGTLVRAEAHEAAIDLSGDAVWCAFYVNELVLRLLHRHEAHGDLYEAYEQVLRALAAASCQEAVLRVFEKRLLAALGYGLGLTHDARTGEPIRAAGSYHYLQDEGAIERVSDQGGPGVTGATLMALATETFTDPRQLREAKGLLRNAITHLLGDKPLHTRSLFRSVRHPL